MKTISHREHREHRERNDFSVLSVLSVANSLGDFLHSARNTLGSDYCFGQALSPGRITHLARMKPVCAKEFFIQLKL
jgi:hypothetical protein